ncbi:MAG: hypothetical protein Q8P59_03880 [Dehalococcoidia bacterium]|nr:hypothetical protein [Dehalococcoidia bacterium]
MGDQTMAQEAAQRTAREEELARDGWHKKFTAAEPKLSEYVKLYEEMGFEVRVEPVTREELGQDCSSCLMAACDMYRTIYTRPRQQ